MNNLVQRLKEWWAGLAPRERILVGVSAGMLASTALILGIINPLLAMSGDSGSRIESAKMELERMIRLEREYSEIQARLAGVEARIKNQQGQQNIRTLLENLAQESSVRIASMEERQAGKNDHYVETKVEVSLKNVSLSQTIKYLHNIEASNQQLSVKGLRIRGRGQGRGEETLDVTFFVSSFRAA
jgi:type II secretory pathway component PulM